jgi:hypothetical protein
MPCDEFIKHRRRCASNTVGKSWCFEDYSRRLWEASALGNAMRCAEAPVRCETISRPALSQHPRYVRVVSSTLSCKVLHYRPSSRASASRQEPQEHSKCLPEAYSRGQSRNTEASATSSANRRYNGPSSQPAGGTKAAIGAAIEKPRPGGSDRGEVLLSR